MGLDLTLRMVDWQRLREIPAEERIRTLDEATWPTGLDDESYSTYGLADGWVWPPDQDPAWCAEYRFFSTSGSYKPHSRAGNAWGDMRMFADESLRVPMDRFLNGLIWDEEPDENLTLTGSAGFFPPADRWRPHLLLVCPPEAARLKARAWELVAPHLEQLRGPFAAECEGWAGRPDTFEEFTTLVLEWGDVVTETAGRGFGLVGLP
ncbi:hypothetical protein [Streptomyces sp. AC555_RSS877]|uniref:hypothetical protein n=1 Tax=Streptomyces sp. AC555_RSS877 TaxID=2823688 RepID=UPI001C2809BE|nr:hypothetical protein [Streptomyces sp. AC555_RSS877]